MSFKTIELHWSSYTRNDDPDIITLAVNADGEGLFFWSIADACYKQWRGTGQFFARTPKEMMRKLRVIYEDQIGHMIRDSADGW
jgi:hypothetical protein